MRSRSAYIYETRTITGENVAVDDVVEAVNSFELFDEMIDRLGEPITAETMKVIQQASGRISGKRYYDGPLP